MKAPVKEATEHAAKGRDETAQPEVKYINSLKGTVCVFSLHLSEKKKWKIAWNKAVL